MAAKYTWTEFPESDSTNFGTTLRTAQETFRASFEQLDADIQQLNSAQSTDDAIALILVLGDNIYL